MIARRILAALALLCFAAPSLAQIKTKAAIQGEVNANLPNNTTGAITPSIMRGLMTDVINSYFQGSAVNTQTSTTYTVQCSDMGSLLTFSNSSAVAVTLPSAATSCFNNNWAASFKNNGSGSVTITPLTGTINGTTSVTLINAQGLYIASDGTNWQTWGGFATQSWAVNGSNISYTAGDVGIGTTSPTAQLDTTGTVRFRGITNGCLTADNSGNVTATSCTSAPGASAVLYTPPGPGGVTTTAAAEFNRTIWITDYAQCNGTDETTAIQAAITAAEAQQALLMIGNTLASGGCAFTGTLSITSALTIQGTNNQLSMLLGSGGPTQGMIQVNTNAPINVRDVWLNTTTANKTGGYGIQFNGSGATPENNFSRIERVSFTNHQMAIDFEVAAYWSVSGCLFQNISSASSIQVLIRNSASGDAGDQEFVGNWFFGGFANTTYLVWQNGGGTRIARNKFLGNGTAGVGVSIALAGTTGTGLISLTDNSFDGLATQGISITTAAAANILTETTIANNRFDGGPSIAYIFIQATAGSTIGAVNITANSFAGNSGAAAVDIPSASTALINSNIFGGITTAINITSIGAAIVDGNLLGGGTITPSSTTATVTVGTNK